MELVTCPEDQCEGGEEWRECPCVLGPPSVVCLTCGGLGQIRVGVCALCVGKGEITLPLAHLYEADLWVRRNDPGWKGSDMDHPGITVYSQAYWFRERGRLRGEVVSVLGSIGPQQEPIVALFGEHRNMLLKLRGFAWGYGGEGPTGLADVLCDISEGLPTSFPAYESARLFVGGLPGDKGWTRIIKSGTLRPI